MKKSFASLFAYAVVIISPTIVFSFCSKKVTGLETVRSPASENVVSSVKSNEYTGPVNEAVLSGKKLCRSAPGPDDTLGFEITLLESGVVEGTGSKSGATLNLTFDSGTWKVDQENLKMELIFAGSSYGPEGQKPASENIFLSILARDVLASAEACFEYPGQF